MYEAVHAVPDGESTVARLALTASEHGYDGIVVRNHGDAPASYAPEEISEEYGVDVVPGVEVRASDPSRASGFVGNHRQDRPLVAVHGGDPAINRFAVEQAAVDVLAHPMEGEGDFNHVLAREAADNGVRVELSLARVLRRDGGPRVQSLRDLRKLHELVTHYDTPFVVSGDPFSHLHLRSPRELRALGEVVGISGEDIERGLTEWGRLVERNRDRLSDEFVEPGVWRGSRTE
ncbi:MULTISPECIES: RNase P subunit p30 family protein [Salinibaculum]|uniref:RNase P subunit p30 family protein n=1 Tax=Salinibaculum TaxID=2732368 RepID=UPI0030D4483B